MPLYVQLIIHLNRLASNASAVKAELARHGFSLWAVTKGFCGDLKVAQALFEAGMTRFAAAREAEIAELSRHFGALHIELLYMGLRPLADLRPTRRFLTMALSGQSTLAGTSPGLLFIDTGARREGPSSSSALKRARSLQASGACLVGVATNPACTGTHPDPVRSVERLSKIRRHLMEALDLPLRETSIGSSSLLSLFWGKAPKDSLLQPLSSFCDLRIGEAILLGRETTKGQPLKGLRGDVFSLKTPVLSCEPERGRFRLVIGLGRMEIGAGVITPLPRYALKPGRRTSDYQVAYSSTAYRLGDTLTFSPSYEALAAAFSSPLVTKFYR